MNTYCDSATATCDAAVMNDPLPFDAKADHWANFYRSGNATAPVYPSQFAAFAINELSDIDGIVEFGCGNGRDSHFFASNGVPILALDAAETAIALCIARNQHRHARYVANRASKARAEVEGFVAGKNRIAVYARFFLHAIDAKEQHAFLAMTRQAIPAGSVLLLEYRTTDDAGGDKVFGHDHYRRYLDHLGVLSAVTAAGFDVRYQIEGRGLAKYGNEDAMVGRCVAVKA